MLKQSDGDRSRYEAWVRGYSADLYRLAYRLCGSRLDAEDLVQETFYEAWRSMHQLREPEKEKYWLIQILRHRYHHWLRFQRRHPVRSMDVENMDSLFFKGTEERKFWVQEEILQKALDQLAPEIKEIFLLVFLEGWTCRETAQHLDLPLGTVLSRIHRARLFLRQRIPRPDVRQSSPRLNLDFFSKS